MSDQIITKTCTKCKQVKPLSEFSPRKSRPCGYKSCCKVCASVDVITYYYTDKGKAAAKQYRQSINRKIANHKYKQTEKGKVTERRYYRKSYYKDFKIKSRVTVSQAIRNNRLPSSKLLKCTYCQNQANEYHHHLGYDKVHWLDVIPICHICHKRIHSINQTSFSLLG